MNTPTHVVINGLLLGRRREATWLPVTLGALTPDLPMVGFYLYQRLGRGHSEARIWSELYFDPGWQAFFDVFNSLPLILLSAALAWRLGLTAWVVFFASMALHCMFDLPFHREDAHAHFFPLSTWHFVSPVSYWQPAHFGGIVLTVELAVIFLGGLWLGRRAGAWRGVAIATALVALAFGAFAALTWSGGA